MRRENLTIIGCNVFLSAGGEHVGRFSSHSAAYHATRMCDDPGWTPLGGVPMAAEDAREFERMKTRIETEPVFKGHDADGMAVYQLRHGL